MVRNCVPAPLKMETTFYEDSYPSVNHLKRNMTLDLNSARSPLKRNKYGTPMLSTPDLNKLIPTPELERLIAAPGTDILFPPAPTEEQELYARGFEDALNQLHHNSDSSQAADMQGPLPGRTYTNLDLPQGYQPSLSFGAEGVLIKDEPQTVPSIGSSPPLSPIDMESQEKIKLERKRQRNRVAASKCRRRKLERISRLEDKVKLLKGENSELSSVVFKLKEHVCLLKEQVMEHVQSGCAIVPSSTF